jgi:hypothetical protein
VGSRKLKKILIFNTLCVSEKMIKKKRDEKSGAKDVSVVNQTNL